MSRQKGVSRASSKILTRNTANHSCKRKTGNKEMERATVERPRNMVSTGNFCLASGRGRELKRYGRTRKCKIKEKGESGEKGKKTQRTSCFSLFPIFHFAFFTQESKLNTMDISIEKRTNFKKGFWVDKHVLRRRIIQYESTGEA